MRDRVSMKTPSRRPGRVGEMLRMAVSEVILRGLRDPRIGLATVTEVKMSPDLKKARVFVSVLGNREDREKTLLSLNRAAAHIRHEISSYIKLRTAPELDFQYDHSIEYGARIEELLEQTKTDNTPDQ